MSSIACVFPGQGSQHPEMLKTDLVNQSFINDKIEIVSQILQSDVNSILEDESKLNATSFTQPLLVLSSAIFSEAYKNLSLSNPKVIAGHSLGEYSALMFAESITFEDAIEMTHLRGKLMQNSEEGKMMAILGLDSKTIDEACSQINESHKTAYVASANYNSAKQIVIAGNIGKAQSPDTILKAAENLKIYGKIKIKFHTVLNQNCLKVIRLLVRWVQVMHFAVPAYMEYTKNGM